MGYSKDKMNTHNRLFLLLAENKHYKDLRSAFDKLMDGPLWFIADKITMANIKPMPRTQRARDIGDYMALADYKNSITSAMKESQETGKAVLCANTVNDTHGICVPLIYEGKIFGYYGVCAVKEKPIPGIVNILASYTDIIILDIVKDMELSRVYELVRPRAIALSTVHTVHRLISSTLDMKELFPRIARLSLQVLKAEAVSICMIDKSTKRLSCVASVDYRKSKDMFKARQKPSYVDVKVAQTGRSRLSRHIISMPLVDDEVCGVITVRDKIGGQKFTIFDQEILTTLAEQAVIAIRNAQLYKEQEDITIGVIRALSHLLDAKFPRIYTHTEFFVELILMLGKQMGLEVKQLKVLHYAALLPDLGKLVVPEEILKKARALSGSERKIIKSHTIRGIEILKYLNVLKPVTPIILHHHERYDGKGYPDKLKGKKIPQGARIMSVADTFEAMVCNRPYRKPLPFRMAVSEIRRQAGTQFDPDVVEALMSITRDGRLENLIHSHRDELKRPF